VEDVLETAAVFNTVNVGVAPDVDGLLDGAVMKGVVDGLAGMEDFIAVLKNSTASETTVINASSLSTLHLPRLLYKSKERNKLNTWTFAQSDSCSNWFRRTRLQLTFMCWHLWRSRQRGYRGRAPGGGREGQSPLKRTRFLCLKQ